MRWGFLLFVLVFANCTSPPNRNTASLGDMVRSSWRSRELDAMGRAAEALGTAVEHSTLLSLLRPGRTLEDYERARATALSLHKGRHDELRRTLDRFVGHFDCREEAEDFVETAKSLGRHKARAGAADTSGVIAKVYRQSHTTSADAQEAAKARMEEIEGQISSDSCALPTDSDAEEGSGTDVSR